MGFVADYDKRTISIDGGPPQAVPTDNYGQAWAELPRAFQQVCIAFWDHEDIQNNGDPLVNPLTFERRARGRGEAWAQNPGKPSKERSAAHIRRAKDREAAK